MRYRLEEVEGSSSDEEDEVPRSKVPKTKLNLKVKAGGKKVKTEVEPKEEVEEEEEDQEEVVLTPAISKMLESDKGSRKFSRSTSESSRFHVPSWVEEDEAKL